MFRPEQAKRISWETFVEQVVAAKKSLSVVWIANISYDYQGTMTRGEVKRECMLDLAKLQADIKEVRQTRNRPPIFMQPACTYS